MKIAARPIVLFATLALGFALGAVATARMSAVPAAPHMVMDFPVGGVDSSVPSASTVTFPAGVDTGAPTF